MIHPFAWVAILLLLLAGILLDKGIMWGALFGTAIGVLLIYMGSRETNQIVKETPFGTFLCGYYLICTLISYHSNKKS